MTLTVSGCHPPSHSRTICYPKGNPGPSKQTLLCPFPPTPGKTPLWICLFCESHVNGVMPYVTFYVGLLSHRIFPRPMSAVVYVSTRPFSWVNNIPSLGYPTLSHSSADGHGGCFHRSAVMNKTVVVCIHVHIFFEHWF